MKTFLLVSKLIPSEGEPLRTSDNLVMKIRRHKLTLNQCCDNRKLYSGMKTWEDFNKMILTFSRAFLDVVSSAKSF